MHGTLVEETDNSSSLAHELEGLDDVICEVVIVLASLKYIVIRRIILLMSFPLHCWTLLWKN